MISDAIGLCKTCNQSHEVPISGLAVKGKKIKFTVYNTICNSCVEKLDHTMDNNSNLERKNEMPLQNKRRQIVMVDATTDTDDFENSKGFPNLKQCNILENILSSEQKSLVQNTSLTKQVIESTSYIEENLKKPENQLKGKSQRCFLCKYCEKEFTHTGDLNKHIRIHTREQPYDCSHCHKKFSLTSNLKRHKLLHSGEKPFSCSLCGNTFSRKDKLDTHISKHHINT